MTSPLALKIGGEIKKQRELRKLAQEDLGNLIGVTRGSVCNYERGTSLPSLECFIAIGEHFNISLDILAGRELQNEIKLLAKLLEEAIEEKFKLKQEVEKYKKLLAGKKI